MAKPRDIVAILAALWTGSGNNQSDFGDVVLEMKVPHGADMGALQAALPIFLTYVLSYINIGIFWNNHHHMLHATERVDGRVLWANLLLLFWLSLVPFVIRWIDEAGFTPLPVAAYGIVLAMAAMATPCFSQRSSREMAEAPLWRRLSAAM